ncbi:MAG: OmpA family protein [Burkholderiaceae bacterium]|nr:OmpA family protein [Burkholderiaceae bacterium]
MTSATWGALRLSSLLALSLSLGLLTGCATPPAPTTMIAIDQTPRGVHIRLISKVLLFEFDKAVLNIAAAAPYLDKIAALIINKSSKQVAVEGYTDNIGTLAANQIISDARAKAVSDALQERGVPADRLKPEGFSFHRPVMSNSNEEGRALNRRVEIVILDETIENITAGEPANTFESAFAKLKAMVDQGFIKPL